MKLSKVRLKKMILEVMQEQGIEDPTKIRTGSMTTGARMKSARDRITGDGGEEFTNQEQNVIDQLESFISDLAAKPGVDLMKFRPLLQRVLKLLQHHAGKDVTQPQQGESE